MLSLCYLPALRRTQIYFWIRFPFFSTVPVDFFSIVLLFQFLVKKMGSRRTTHSSFPNGRPSNGSDVSGSSRPTSCSYLSNVRPENRQGSGERSCTVATLLVQHAPGNMKILNDLRNLWSKPTVYYLSFVCCHGHQHLNKLQIKQSISVMQNGPHFISSSMLQLTANSFSMARCVHGGVTGQTRHHVKASSVLEKIS